MTSLLARTAGTADRSRLGTRWYLAASAPFYVIFVGSVVLTFVDLEATRVATAGFGFPTWVVVPQGVAKALGLAAIVARRSRLLVGLAFAGFFYDVLLALGTHLVQRDVPNILLATSGLLAVVAAYCAHQRRFPSAPAG